MSISRKHFVNDALRAANVLEIDIDRGVMADLARIAAPLHHAGPADRYAEIGGGIRLCLTRPNWDSDIVWASQVDRRGYDFFDGLFRRLQIGEQVRQFIDHDRDIVLYSGFFVTRSYCSAANHHHDWIDADNDAFTYLGPVSANCDQLGLTYQNLKGEEAHYTYRAGKGLVFGDYFLHSTAPGRASETTVLLSFTFGTDRMDKWPQISQTAASQGEFYRQPDGQFIALQQPKGSY